MPEFAEVNLQVKWLRERVTGWKIDSFGYTSKGHFPALKDEPDKDQILKEFFTGATIERVSQRGKLVVFTLSSGTLFSHLMFKGRWSLKGDDFLSNYKQHKKAPTPQSANFWIESTSGERLNFHEPENMGKVHAFPGARPREVEELSSLGAEALITPETEPDFSSRDWTLADFTKNIAKIKKSIKEFLLDQKKQTGLGNMYVCEALYQARIKPDRAANSLSADEAEALHDAARSILRQSIDSVLDYDKILKVYRRETDPDGNPVEESQVGGRDTFWVPAVQR
jgi:formamidopyrimidine-DNA glycosylase